MPESLEADRPADPAADPKPRLRVNSTHSRADRGLDMYPTPPEATRSLLALERLPRCIWEPAAGDGAIVQVLEAAGHTVVASDIANYGAGYEVADYMTAPAPPGIQEIVTNPPYSLIAPSSRKLAAPFAEKAIREVPYVALLARINWLAAQSRHRFFQVHPPARIWVSTTRLPMMHRRGWTGPEASSNHDFAWFVWDAGAERTGQLGWFDWRECAA